MVVYVCIRATGLVIIIPNVAENSLRHDVAWWWPEHFCFRQVIKRFYDIHIFIARSIYLLLLMGLVGPE